MLDLLFDALQVLGWSVAFLAAAVSFVLIFWPDKPNERKYD